MTDAPPTMSPADQTMYLLSFLMLLVWRAGGVMRIEHLSEIAGNQFILGMKPDFENDAVTLKVVEQPHGEPT